MMTTYPTDAVRLKQTVPAGKRRAAEFASPAALLSFEKAAYGFQGQFRSLEERSQKRLVVPCLAES
jgi:hypothetical protein